MIYSHLDDIIVMTKGQEFFVEDRKMNKNEQELVKKARRDYARSYRARNPERAKEIQQRYWLRRALREQEATTAAEPEGNDGERKNG